MLFLYVGSALKMVRLNNNWISAQNWGLFKGMCIS